VKSSVKHAISSTVWGVGYRFADTPGGVDMADAHAAESPLLAEHPVEGD
jgi:hypothetical protein